MEELVEELLDLEGVKSVRRFNDSVLRVELYSRSIPGSELFEISGDLRKISQKIRSCLEQARQNRVFSSWEWVVKPEKKYQKTSLGRKKVKDRKGIGYKKDYYEISVS